MLGRELRGVGITKLKGIPPELSGGAKVETQDAGELGLRNCVSCHTTGKGQKMQVENSEAVQMLFHSNGILNKGIIT